MVQLTIPGAVVFDPTDAGGNARGMVMGEAQVWAIQIERRYDEISEAVVAGIETRLMPVAAATTTNITLSGEQTIDGVLTSASRVLVHNQSTPSQNGLYVSGAGAWSRASDADTAAKLSKAAIYVSGGGWGGTTFWCSIAADATLGTDACYFIPISDAQDASAVEAEVTAARGGEVTLADALALKASDAAVVKLTGNQTVAGTKTFSSAPSVPDASFSIAKTSGLQSSLDKGIAADLRVNTLGTTAGTSSAFTASRPSAALAAYATGQMFSIVPHTTAAATPTLNVDSVGALTIKDANGGDLAAGDIVSGRVYTLQAYSIGVSPHLRVVAGRLGSWSDTKLPNLFSNGQLDPAGKIPAWYGDVLGTRLYRADVVDAGAALAAYGIVQAIAIPAESGGNNSGTQAVHNVTLTGGSVFFALMVELTSGDWPTDPVLASMDYTDASATNGSLTTYVTITSALRLYYGTIALTAAKTTSRIRLGIIKAQPRTYALEAGGFWASHLSRGGSALIGDTAFPNWNATTPAHRSDLVGRLAALEARTTLQQLRDALLDDLHSINLCLIGDSLTWGLTASNVSETEPRDHDLADPRNTVAVTSPSWANLLRDWLARSFVPGSLTTGDPGVGSHRQVVTLDPCDDPRFRLLYKDSLVPLAKSLVTSGSTTHGRYFVLSYATPTMLEFDFVGDDFTFVYARNVATSALSIAMQIDDESPTTSVIGSDGAVAFKAEKNFTTTFGRHRVRIWANGTADVRVEAIKHNRQLLVRNQGIIGTNTTEWLPSGDLFEGVLDEDEFVIGMIGTNNNDGAGAMSAKVRSNLVTIVEQLLTDGKVPILMTPPPEFTAGQTYPATMTAQAIAAAASDTGVSLIDNFRAFMAIDDTSLAADYIQSDDVHLTDAGHQVIFRNLVRAIADCLPAAA